MRFIIILIVLTITFSCKKEQSLIVNDNLVSIDSIKITKEDISKINYLEYGVDAKAKNKLDSWQAYNTVAKAIDEIKAADFKFFETDDEEFNTALKDIATTVPLIIDNEPVNARVLVLKTKLLKLREALSLKTIKKRERLIAIKELFQSFSYLTLQINKKFEKEAQSIIKPDSI